MALKLVGLNPDRDQPGRPRQGRPPRRHKLSIFKQRVHGRKPSPGRGRRNTAPPRRPSRTRHLGRKKHCRLRPPMHIIRRRKQGCCSCAVIMWTLTGVVMVLITALLIAFRHKLGATGPLEKIDESEEIRDPAAVAAKLQRLKKEAEKKAQEAYEKMLKEQHAQRMSLNSRNLTPADLHVQGHVSQTDIRKAENHFQNKVRSGSLLKRKKEKLWAVAVILYTDVACGNGWYRSMNASLRNGESTYKGYENLLNDALHYIIREEGEKVPPILYRGLGFPASMKGVAEGLRNGNCAKIAKSGQFDSTSTHKTKPLQFMNSSGNGRNTYKFFCEYHGITQAAKVMDYGFASETEWLVPTDVNFQVLNTKGDWNSRVDVKMKQDTWKPKIHQFRRRLEDLGAETTTR